MARIFILTALLFVNAESAMAADFTCPATIITAQTLNGDVPTHWLQYHDQTAPVSHLQEVLFSDGSPQERIVLGPKYSGIVGSNRVDRYVFDVAAGRKVWMSCSYVATSITLTREVGGAGSKCIVTFIGVGDTAAPKSVTCNP